LVVAAMAVAVLAGCSGVTATGGSAPSTLPPGPPTGGATGPEHTGGPTDGPGDGPTDLPPTPPNLPTEPLEVHPAVVSGNQAGGVNLTATTAYLTESIAIADQIWSGWFASAGLPEPYVQYKIIQPGETYTVIESCKDQQGATSFTSTYPNAFYCGNQYNGVDKGIHVLPVETMAKMWKGDIFGRDVQTGPELKRVGDFAAGTLVAHEFGHHVQDELTETSGRAAPPNPHIELIADCFAGVYAHSLSLGGKLEAGDIEEAVNALEAIGDNNGSHGTGPQRENAFRIGYSGTQADPRGGVPYTCIKVYWPSYFTG
jgi:hypothetical protein